MNSLQSSLQNILNKFSINLPTAIIAGIVVLLCLWSCFGTLGSFAALLINAAIFFSALVMIFLPGKHKKSAETVLVVVSLALVLCVFNSFIRPVFAGGAYYLAIIAALISIGYWLYCLVMLVVRSEARKKYLLFTCLSFFGFVFIFFQIENLESEDHKAERIQHEKEEQQKRLEQERKAQEEQELKEAARKAEEEAELAKIVKEGEIRKTIVPSFVYSTIEDLEEGEQSIQVRDKQGIIELVVAGKCCAVDKDIDVLIIDSDHAFMKGTKYKIRIKEGPLAGVKGWTPERTLVE